MNQPIARLRLGFPHCLWGLLLLGFVPSGAALGAKPAPTDSAIDAFDAIVGPAPSTLYWIERNPRGGGTGSRGPGPGQSMERGAARCVKVRSAPSRRSLTVEGRGSSVGFRVVRKGDRFRLVGPNLTDRRLGHAVVGNCSVTLTPKQRASARAPIVTDRGTIFFERSACRAAAKGGYRYVCKGRVCSYTQDAAPVLDLGKCEAEKRRLAGVLNTLAQASEAQRLSAQRRLVKTWRSGGSLFEPAPPTDAKPCRRVRVKPAGDLKGDIVFGRERAKDKPYETAGYTLFPTLRLARLGPRGGRTAGGGEYGMGGSGAKVPLYFAKARVYLGGRWLFFDAKTCRRN